jgi:hypothetical protein
MTFGGSKGFIFNRNKSIDLGRLSIQNAESEFKIKN